MRSGNPDHDATSTAPAVTRRRRRRLLVLLAAPFVGLLLVELGLRVAGVTPLRVPRTEIEIVKPSQIPGLGFQPRPNISASVDYGALRPPGKQIVTQGFNSNGFRGELIFKARQADRGPRILCLGDSHTYGSGVADDETWPARLAQELVARGLTEVEVINAGVPGYDTVQESIWLKQHALDFKPDLVLLQYFLNDTAIRGLQRVDEPEPDWLVQLAHPRAGGWAGALREHWRTADVLFDAVYRGRSMHEHMQRLIRWHAPDDPGAQRVGAALLRARDHALDAGARFGVLLYPMVLRAPNGDGFVSRPALREVARFCTEQRIPVFDGEPALLAAGHDDEALRVAPGDLHGGATAHALFATAVAAWLASPESPAPLDELPRPAGR